MKDFFTKQEKLFIIFLLGGILFGTGAKIYRVYYGSSAEVNSNREKLEQTGDKIAEKAALIDSLLTNDVKNEITSKKANSGNSKSDKPKENRLAKASININTAQLEDLIRLPYIGPVLAQRIIDYRSEYGQFRTLDEIREVKGIGIKKLNSIKPYIFISSKQN